MSASEREQHDELLVRCVLCVCDGPRELLAAHLAADHADEPHGFVVRIASRLREPLQRVADEQHVAVGALVSGAVDRHLQRLAR